MDYRPLFDKVLLEEIVTENKLDGLVLVDSKAGMKKGKVVAVGHGLAGQPMSIAVGQIILYKKDDAQDIPLDGKTYKLLLERNAWMVK